MRSASAKLRASRASRRRVDQPLDLLDRHRRLLVLGLAQRQHAEHPIEPLERLADGGGVAGAQLAGVDRRVQRAHQIEHHAERAGGVQVGGDVPAETPRAPPPAAAATAASCADRAGSVSSRARKSVSRLSASSACAIAAHENFSCLR